MWALVGASTGIAFIHSAFILFFWVDVYTFWQQRTPFPCNNICKHKFRPLPWLKLSFCFGLFQCKTRVTLDGLTFSFCSDACFIQYHKANNFPEVFCNMCCSVCSDKPLVLKDDDGIKIICSDKCLVTFKEVNNLIVKIEFIKYALNIKFNYDVEFSLFYASKLLQTLSGLKCDGKRQKYDLVVFIFYLCRALRHPNPALCVKHTIRSQIWWKIQILRARWNSFAATGAWWCPTVSGHQLCQVHSPPSRCERLNCCMTAF